MSVFKTLSAINTAGKTEKKGQLTYLSWVWAWAEVCKLYQPNRTVYKNESGRIYHDDGKTCWVEVGVEIEGVEHIDYLPIMDFKNNSIPVDKVTSMDVNKAIQRSTTKALALHGLGINVYAGEDLPITPPEPKEPNEEQINGMVKHAVANSMTASGIAKIGAGKYKFTPELIGVIADMIEAETARNAQKEEA